MPVRHAILGLLHQKPRHGYDLRAAFEALVGGAGSWDLKPAQVYSTLQRLERDGHVAPQEAQRIGGPDRVVFGLTEEGRRELASWFSDGVHGDHVRDHFFVKLMVALGTPEAEPREIIRIQRQTLYRDLHALTARRASVDRASELARALLLDKAVMHFEADLRWLDMVEARLSEIEKQPLPQPVARRRGRPPKADVAQAG
jgi:DNA-binding PadR family transcriptional regulator